MKQLSKVLVIMMWALLMVLLVSTRVKADWWSPPTQLTDNVQNRNADAPCISGDGTKIAFYLHREVWVVNSDGTGLQEVAYSGVDYVYTPSISDDGTKIAFLIRDFPDDEVFVVNSDGSGLARLTNNTERDSFPSISDDGTKIAFASDVDGDSEIFVVNSDGTGLTQLTNNTEPDRHTSISGDGTKIAFDSIVDGDWETWVINSDGTGLLQLTNNTETDIFPSISDDGNRITFHSNVDGDMEIFVVNSDSTGLMQLTHNNESDYYPSISGDGSKIAFQSDVDGDMEIFVVNSDGTELMQLTHNNESDYRPSISDDGTKIAFASIVDGNSEILIISQDVYAPVTVDDYDGQWHNADFMINLSPTDELSGAAETYYELNYGPTMSVGSDGQPFITTETAGSRLEYWSVDNAGNEEFPHKVLTGIKLDKTPPVIGEPAQQPEGDVQPDQSVKFSVDVADAASGVKNITLSYTTDNGGSWTNLSMVYNATFSVYQATIPGHAEDTLVKYKILAYDNAGNPAVKDDAGEYYTYNVIPEFPLFMILPLFIMITLLAAIIHKRKQLPKLK